jgi:hypothetical protein
MKPYESSHYSTPVNHLSMILTNPDHYDTIAAAATT